MNRELINEFYLERYVLGELPEEYAQEIRQLAVVDPEIRAALDEIEASNRDILSTYPASAVKAGLENQQQEVLSQASGRAQPHKILPLRRILYFSAALAALLLVVLFLPQQTRKPGAAPFDEGEEYSAVKGTQNIDLFKTQLLIYRKNKDKVELLSDGARAREGDLLQLAYVAASHPYGLIFSIDGRGVVTLHYPMEKNSSVDLLQNKKTVLPHAIELDDAPGFERFFLITSESQIDVDTVLNKAKNLANDPTKVIRAELDLPSDINQYSILVLKGEGS
jgi:hypothetical protein